MINLSELRPGNYILQKINTRILPVRCAPAHFGLGDMTSKDLFPIVLSEQNLIKAGFIENKKYALLPDAHEFIRTLPVPGSGDVEIRAYIKNNKDTL